MQLYKDFNYIMEQHSMLLSCTYEMRGAYSVLVIQLQFFFFNVRTYIYCPWTPFRCCLVSPLSVSPWSSPICSMQFHLKNTYQSQVLSAKLNLSSSCEITFLSLYCNGIELKLIIKRHGKRPFCMHYVETNNHPCFGIASKC